MSLLEYPPSNRCGFFFSSLHPKSTEVKTESDLLSDTSVFCENLVSYDGNLEGFTTCCM